MRALALVVLVVLFSAGCTSWTDFESVLELEIEAPSDVNRFEAIEDFDVVVTNLGAEALDPRDIHFFIELALVDAAGERVWGTLIFPEPKDGFLTLGPGGSQRLSRYYWFTAEGAPRWDQRGPGGVPVGPGDYQVRAALHISWNNSDAEQTITALPSPLVIRSKSLPTYAANIGLAMEIPNRVTAGEIVPMRLGITNSGQEPVLLPFDRTSLFVDGSDSPYYEGWEFTYYLDIVVFADGTPIWQAMPAHGVTGEGTIILAPGETKELGAIFDGYGQPFEWDQQVDCGGFIFRTCGEFAPPGMYEVVGVVSVAPMQEQTTRRALRANLAALATERHTLQIQP